MEFPDYRLHIIFDESSRKYLTDWIEDNPEDLTKKFAGHLRPILRNSGQIISDEVSDKELLNQLGYKIRQLRPTKK